MAIKMNIIDFTFQDRRNGGGKSIFCLGFIMALFFFKRKASYVLPMFRLCQYLKGKRGIVANIFKKYAFHRYSSLAESFNVYMPVDTSIGKYVCFAHYFPVVINPSAIIGENCIIHPCVLIARDRGKDGAPVIGDNCFVGHGAKIIGNPTIGEWSFICPGAIVTKDMPNGSLIGSGVNNLLSQNGKEHVLLYQM